MANEHRTGMTSAHSGFISRFTLGTGALTFAAKDTLDIAGYPTRAGSPVLQKCPGGDSACDGDSTAAR